LSARLASPLAPRGTLGPPRREQLELLQPAQQFGGDEGVGHRQFVDLTFVVVNVALVP
jgi:hypothetical protein